MNRNKYEKELLYLKKYENEEGNGKKFDRDDVISKLSSGVPIQYIIGNVNFYGNKIKVTKDVLIPRFETELLVEKTILKIKKYFPNKKVTVIDMGTGSGCIAISLKKEINCQVDAIDISLDALRVASDSAKENNVEINFMNKDMTVYCDKRYDVIISNPPYIRCDEEIMDIVRDNEPKISLYAKENGTYYYRKILENAKNIVNDKYLICFEIGIDQEEIISEIALKNLGDVEISVEKDYSSFNRFIFITNKSI